MKRFFIPSQHNKHRPYLIRSRALALYSVFLITFQVGFSYFWQSQNTDVVAATTITASDLYQLTNDERSKLGLERLSYNDKLAKAAYNKGVDMFADQYWSHNAPDGTTPWDFILAVGYDYHYAGENLAKDFTSATSVITAWMNSPSHRENIVNTNFEDIGIAVVTGIFEGQETTICVQMFGTLMPQIIDTPEPESPTEKTPTQYNTPSETNTSNNPTEIQENSENTIPTIDNIPPEAPVIIAPQNNALLNDDQPEISGTASEPSTINIYDAQQKLGTLPTDEENAFSFRPLKPLQEGEHLISATATDNNDNTSEPSKITTLIIDTFPPFIDEDSINLESFYRYSRKALRIEVIVLADPQEVTASLGDYSLILKSEGNNRYTGIISPPEDLFEQYLKIKISSHDEASNVIEIEKEIPLFPQKSTQDETTGAILGVIQQNTRSFIEKAIPQNNQETSRLFYGLFGLGLMGLMTINTASLEKNKIPAQGANTLTHAFILGISVMGIIWGNLGIITSGMSMIR